VGNLPDQFSDNQLVLAAEAQIKKYTAEATLIQDLLKERRSLLQALRPFAEAAQDLPPEKLYRPQPNYQYKRHVDPVIVSIGRETLRGFHFARALDRYVEATQDPGAEQSDEKAG